MELNTVIEEVECKLEKNVVYIAQFQFFQVFYEEGKYTVCFQREMLHNLAS